ncbi:DUF1045 domain-containing protein [Rhizobium sp. L1K21]|uniref:DUF1045 domain-containing protein n=1 Tax=Rhizobium sp. L1K21 TaxID=2954933 RepID=UPI0020931AC5|nr:DUF1045 domain-containing protein [Rhizobium sp. L1K21]
MRYAIYFTPPKEDPLVKAAAAWLGRCAFGGTVEDLGVENALVREPARYGFHGTLKAPFSLAEGATEEALIDAFDTLAASTRPFDIAQIKLALIGPFFALVPAEGEEHQISVLAEDAVRKFEPFRAPLGHADIERRNPASLSERQRRYLMDWGYPYVFEDFRFHMTLTGKVPEEKRDEMRDRLEKQFGAFVGNPLRISHLALFCEPTRGASFDVLRLRELPDR